MGRPYAIYDVFTREPLAGNPLAVVFDASGLDAEAMQTIAREFNLSETVFLTDPGSAPDRVGVRIFTPGHELPFAGHPTLGSAIAAAHRRGVTGSVSLVLEEGVGDIAAEVRTAAPGRGFGTFALPVIAEPIAWEPDVARIAAALGLDASDIGFGDHECSAFHAGLDYFFVPVRDRSVIDRVQPSNDTFQATFPGRSDHESAYVYCPDTVSAGAAYHARMFWWLNGVREDAATGSAVASFLGVVMRFEQPADGTTAWVIEQGFRMERPSEITLEADVRSGVATGARIGGHAVRIAAGELDV